MKALVIAIPLIALVAVGIVGPFAMLHSMAEHAVCPIASAAQLPCSLFENIAEHIVGFQNLLTTIPATAVLASLVAFFIFAFLLPGMAPTAPRFSELARQTSIAETPRARETFLNWQARLAHSPTAS